MRALVVESSAVCGEPGEERSRLVPVACCGGLAAPEVGVGLDLRLPSVDPERVPGRSGHLLGQLVAPETAPATRDTVQVDFHEELPDAVQGFGLVELRARVPWCVDGRHVLLFHRQMPSGWPEGDHHQADGSALSGRTAAVTGPATVYLGVPVLTPDRTKVCQADVPGLETALGWMREVAGAGQDAADGAPWRPERAACRSPGAGADAGPIGARFIETATLPAWTSASSASSDRSSGPASRWSSRSSGSAGAR